MLEHVRILLAGNLLGRPRLRRAREDQFICWLLVVTNRFSFINGQWKKRGRRYLVRTTGEIAENCAKYLEKGAPLIVAGRLEGSGGRDHRITADEVQFLGLRTMEPSHDTLTNGKGPKGHKGGAPRSGEDH